jgi:ABC-type transport system involved in multi-copper enzyme maturation permease subunit
LYSQEGHDLRNIILIFKREIISYLKTPSFTVLAALFALIAAAAAAAGAIVFGRVPAILQDKNAAATIIPIAGLFTYFLPLSIILSFIWAFAGIPLIKEKTGGVINSLLAAKIKPKEILFAKSLAIFIPAYVLSLVYALTVLFVLNYLWTLPIAGFSIMSLPAMLTGLIINPLLFFALLMIVILLSLAKDPETGIAPSFIVGFGLIIGVLVAVLTGYVSAASWQFFFYNLAGAIVLWVVAISLGRILTNEMILQSSVML